MESKKVGLTLAVIMLLSFSILMMGCGSTSSERIDAYRTAVSVALEQEQTIDEAIATLEAKIIEMQSVLQDPKLNADLREDVTAALVKAQGVLATLNKSKEEVAIKLKEWQQALQSIDSENATIWDEVRAWSTGLTTVGSTAPSPWGSYLKLIGLIIGGVGAIGAGIKHGKAAASGVVATTQQEALKAKEETSSLKTAIKQVVSSVDSVLKSVDKTTADEYKTVLKTYQDDATRNVVRAAQHNTL